VAGATPTGDDDTTLATLTTPKTSVASGVATAADDFATILILSTGLRPRCSPRRSTAAGVTKRFGPSFVVKHE